MLRSPCVRRHTGYERPEGAIPRKRLAGAIRGQFAGEKIALQAISGGFMRNVHKTAGIRGIFGEKAGFARLRALYKPVRLRRSAGRAAPALRGPLPRSQPVMGQDRQTDSLEPAGNRAAV